MNAVNPIDPSESINLHGHNQLILSFCDLKVLSNPLKTGFLQGMSLEGTYPNAQIPFQSATVGSTEGILMNIFPLKAHVQTPPPPPDDKLT